MDIHTANVICTVASLVIAPALVWLMIPTPYKAKDVRRTRRSR